jgi:hypothetical protein
MKRLRSLFVTGLCLLAACDPTPSPPTAADAPLSATHLQGLVMMPLGDSLQALDLTYYGDTSFESQKVCTTSAEHTIQINNTSPVPRRISSAGVTSPFILTSIKDADGGMVYLPHSLEAGKSLFLQVKFSPWEFDFSPGSLEIVSDAPSNITLQIPLTGQATGPRLEPSSSLLIITSTAHAGDGGVPDDGGMTELPYTRTVMLRNRGTETLSLKAAINSPFSLSPEDQELLLPAGGSRPLTVTFTPPSSGDGFFSGTLNVSSNDPCAGAQKITVLRSLTSEPQAVWSPTALAFPKQAVGSSGEQSVTLANEGGARLTVSSVSIQGEPDAGTPFTVSPSGRFELEPGQSRSLSVEFSPTAPGHQQATLQLASNSKTPPPSLALSGDAIKQPLPIIFNSSEVKFATRGADEPGEESVFVEVTNTGSSSLVLTSSTTTLAALNPFSVFPASMTLAPQQSMRLTVKFNSSGLGEGVFAGQLKLTDKSSQEVSTLELQGNVIDTLFTVPSQLTFGTHELGVSTPSDTAILHNKSDSPVTIFASLEADSQFSVSNIPPTGLVIGPNKSESIKVTFTPSKWGSFTEKLRIKNTPKQIAPEITLTGTALAPSLSLTKQELSFSPLLPYGESSPQSVTLKNGGNLNVTLTGVSLDESGDFTLKSSTPRSMAAGQELVLEFSFTPKSAGEKTVNPIFHLQTESGRTLTSRPNFWLKGAASGPIALFSTEELRFGAQQVNKTQELQLGVSNHKDSSEKLKLKSVEIIGVHPTAGAFTMDPITTTEAFISPGASREPSLKVNFKPTVAETYTGELRVTYIGDGSSQTVTRKLKLSGKGAPVLVEYSPRSLDFKTIPQTTETKEIVITNKSEVSIYIQDASIDPSTTAFSYNTVGWPNNSIAPNSQRTIKVNFNPASSTVSEARSLIVKFADASSSELKIPLTGKAGVPIASFENLQYRFTNVPRDGKGVQVSTITNKGTTTLRVNAPLRTPPPADGYQEQITWFSKPYTLSSDGGITESEWPVHIKEGETVSFKINFQPKAGTPSSLSEEFTIKSNSNGDEASSATLRVEGNIVSPILEWERPVEFSFAPTLNQESNLLDGTLFNSGQAPLIISSISISNEAVSYFCIINGSSCDDRVEGTTINAASYMHIQVKAKALHDTELHTGTLIIASNNANPKHANPKQFEVPLRAKALGGLTVSPAVVNFEPCNLLAKSKPHLLKLTNSGASALEVSSIQFKPAGDFSTGPLPAEPIQPGSSKDISLYFHPRSGTPAGHRSAKGTVYLKSGDPLEFNVTGTATLARLQVSQADPPPDDGGADTSNLNFGGVRAGTRSIPLTLTLKNVTPAPMVGDAGIPEDGGTSVETAGELTITSIRLEGQDKGLFTLSEPFVEPRTLAVNDTLDVTLFFEPDTVRTMSADLVVTSDASQGSQYRVRLSGEGRSSVLEISPLELDFHKRAAGALSPPKQTVTIKNKSLETISVTSLSITDDVARTSLAAQTDHFSVPSFTPQPLPPGGSLGVDVTFLPRAGIQSAAMLKVTSDAAKAPDAGVESPEGWVKLRGEGLSSVFKDLETTVDFGTLKVNGTASELLEFTNDSSQTIQLQLPLIPEGTRAADFHISFPEKAGNETELVVPSGGRIKMKVEYKPTAVSTAEVQLNLETTDQKPSAATVTLKGKAVASYLEVEPMEVDFGWEDQGVPGKQERITLTNRSDSEVQVSLLTKPGPAFIVDESELSQKLPPGGSLTLHVSFSPVVGGPALDELKLHMWSTDTSTRDIQTDIAIQLRGQGQERPEGGGCSCGASGGGSLLAGWLLLLALGARRRSRRASP